jgi:glycosyltransferase involved in cell wall biosynthesis
LIPLILYKACYAVIKYMGKTEISINGRFLTQSITGVQRYAMEVVRAIDNILDDVKDAYAIKLFTPKGPLKQSLPLKNIRQEEVGLFRGHMWEQLELPLYAGNDILLNLCNPAPILRKKQVALMHDVIVFGASSSTSLPFRLWHRTIFRCITHNGTDIVTDSEYSKSEIIRYLHPRSEDIPVLFAGCEHILRTAPDTSIILRNGLADRPYVLAVSSLNPNKNFISVIKAIEKLGDNGVDFVIAGGTNPKVFSQSAASFPKNVKYLGYVTDAELRALYAAAVCFIYPSFYEGFGLPPLEAMVCGAPVIASNTSSIPEVCGDAVYYVNPYSVDSIVEAIGNVVTHEELRQKLVRKGMLQTKKFTWDCTARGLLNLCQKKGAE